MKRAYRGLFATDMDGTLYYTGRGFHRNDLAALERLGDLKYLRVIASGRSPFSFNRMMGEQVLPVDYLVLSSGASIQSYPGGDLLRARWMTGDDTASAVEVLSRLKLDFTIQGKVPDNHKFIYSYNSLDNPDLERRIDLYSGHCRPMEGNCCSEEATQIVVVVPPKRSLSVLEKIMDQLGDSHSILRTTSPLDGRSLWIELFPQGVSKSDGVSWLAENNGLSPEDSAAIGNDYNDHDLLEWAGMGFVVQDSPEHLLTKFIQVSTWETGGVSEAVRLWLVQRGELSEEEDWP